MKRDEPEAERTFALNGLSVQSLRLNQEGELDVEFDLPGEQTTTRWHTQVRGKRTLNVYDDPELKDACKRLFQVVRRRVMEPDPERVKVHCDRCATSSCCRNYNVLVTDEDLDRLARHFRMSLVEFRARYTAPAVDWSDDYAAQLSCDRDDSGQEKCVFLKPFANGQFRCSVYEDRPRICRDFDMNCCDDFVAMKHFVPVSQVAPLPALVPSEERARADAGGSTPSNGVLS